MQQLQSAKASVVIWTPHSIDSEWVVAEADFMRKWKRLVSTRVAQLDIERIPIQFQPLHTDMIDDVERIVRGLVKLGVAVQTAPAPASDGRPRPLQQPGQLRLLRRPRFWIAATFPLAVFVMMAIGVVNYQQDTAIQDYAGAVACALAVGLGYALARHFRSSLSWIEAWLYWFGSAAAIFIGTAAGLKRLNFSWLGLSGHDIAFGVAQSLVLASAVWCVLRRKSTLTWMEGLLYILGCLAVTIGSAYVIGVPAWGLLMVAVIVVLASSARTT
jgi:hypothetical protein